MEAREASLKEALDVAERGMAAAEKELEEACTREFEAKAALAALQDAALSDRDALAVAAQEVANLQDALRSERAASAALAEMQEAVGEDRDEFAARAAEAEEEVSNLQSNLQSERTASAALRESSKEAIAELEIRLQESAAQLTSLEHELSVQTAAAAASAAAAARVERRSALRGIVRALKPTMRRRPLRRRSMRHARCRAAVQRVVGGEQGRGRRRSSRRSVRLARSALPLLGSCSSRVWATQGSSACFASAGASCCGSSPQSAAQSVAVVHLTCVDPFIRGTARPQLHALFARGLLRPTSSFPPARSSSFGRRTHQGVRLESGPSTRAGSTLPLRARAWRTAIG